MRRRLERLAALAVCALAFAPARAFDSEEWLAKRARLDGDASRMRAAWSNCTACVSSPATGLTIPVAINPDGSPRLVIKASKAQHFPKDGVVWAEGVEGILYGDDGRESARATLSSCVVDLKAKCGWGEGGVRVESGANSMTGEGFYFSQPEEFAKIFTRASMTVGNLDSRAGRFAMPGAKKDKVSKGADK